MKKYVVLGILLAIVLVPTYQASAHELVVDTAGNKGAILHIDPSDNPIAGQKSTLFLAIRDLPDAAAAKGVLMVRSQRGTTQLVSTKFHGSMAYVDYTFPDQGLYHLSFVIKSGAQTYTFNEDEQVARGVAIPGAATKVRTDNWARALFVVSLLLIAAVCIMAWVRRTSIARRSTY